jgi:hypothetical protein
MAKATLRLRLLLCKHSNALSAPAHASGRHPGTGTAFLRELDPAFALPDPKTTGAARRPPGSILSLQPAAHSFRAPPGGAMACAHASGASAGTGTAFLREFDPAFGRPTQKLWQPQAQPPGSILSLHPAAYPPPRSARIDRAPPGGAMASALASGPSAGTGTALFREFDPVFGRPDPKPWEPQGQPPGSLQCIGTSRRRRVAPCCTVLHRAMLRHARTHCCESASTGTTFRREFRPTEQKKSCVLSSPHR